MHRTSVIGDDAAKSPHAVADHRAVSRSAAGGSAILVFSQRPSARFAEADAMEPDEGFESLGSIAVRLVASFRRPKMTLVQSPRGRGSAPASAHDPWEG
jgi:hypothetical protein